MDEFKRLGSGAVAEIEKNLNDKYALPAKEQIPKLQGWILRMGKVKANLLQGLAAQQLPQTALVPQKKGREPFRG
jgi:hypothetical protein